MTAMTNDEVKKLMTPQISAAQLEAQNKELDDWYHKNKELVPKEIRITGAMNFQVLITEKEVKCNHDVREEDIFVSLFSSMNRVKAVQDYSRGEGRKQFTSLDRLKIDTTLRNLESQVENYGHLLFRKCVANFKAQHEQKQAELNTDTQGETKAEVTAEIEKPQE